MRPFAHALTQAFRPPLVGRLPMAEYARSARASTTDFEPHPLVRISQAPRAGVIGDSPCRARPTSVAAKPLSRARGENGVTLVASTLR